MTGFMRQYYIHDGEVKKGPFDLEHLSEQSIKRETPVWYEGLEDWTKAETLGELQTLFGPRTPPPPLPKSPANNTSQRHDVLNSFSEAEELIPEKNKSLLLPIIITIIVIAGIIVTILLYR